MAFQETILEENSVAIYYDQLDDWLYLSWYGPQSLEARKHAFNQLTEFLKTSQCNKILNDNSFNTSSWDDCAFWLTNEWLPKAVQNGLRSIAWVYSIDENARRSADEMISHMNSKIIIIPFNELQNAKLWLHSV